MDFYELEKGQVVIASPATEQDIRSALERGSTDGQTQAGADFEVLRIADKIVDVESLYQEGLKRAETATPAENWWNEAVCSAAYAAGYRDGYVLQCSVQFGTELALQCFENAYEDRQNTMQPASGPAIQCDEDQQDSMQPASEPAIKDDEDQQGNEEGASRFLSLVAPDQLRKGGRSMLDAETIPDTASLHKEEDGVKWYVDGGGVNYMMFEERVLIGCWAGPSWVFRVLTSMSPEERTRYRTHDECMAAINTRLARARGEW